MSNDGGNNFGCLVGDFHGQTAFFCLSGSMTEQDWAQSVRPHVAELFEDGAVWYLFNLARLDELHRNGLHALIKLHQDLRERAGGVILVGLNGQAIRVLAEGCALDFFQIAGEEWRAMQIVVSKIEATATAAATHS